ncbi:DUF2798 domain-containing protein [Sinorhizobium sp. 8-89]|uniref:DUF2798 domain-containing protein n=1 Tax=Sinorhizobium sp. 8-89 TaxID=3049089 RepID=UPI002867BB2B|nr:DUF2798 domain-containing protein [Sinorhizobium sp. 8-89]
MPDGSVPRSETQRSRKMPAKSVPVVFAFFMSAIMALLMSSVTVAANTGFDDGYPLRVITSYALAMPVAFVCVLIVRPLVTRLVFSLCEFQ